ncbi:MAG: Fe-S cluster assembly protein SufD [Parachlamydiaceae bacterium]
MIAEPLIENETFKQLLESFLPQIEGSDPFDRFRKKAWHHFLSVGLPSKKMEAYRRIKLRPLFSQPFGLGISAALSSTQVADFVYPECRESLIVFVNGHYSIEHSNVGALPPQVVICSLQEASETYGVLLNNYWTKSLKEEIDPFTLVNAALHGLGAFVYLPPKTVVETPIQVLHILNEENQPHMAMPRLHIFAGAQSDLHVISTQKNLTKSTPYFVNQVTECVLDEGSHLHYTQALCDENPLSWHFDAIRATLKRDSTFKSVCVTEGSATVRKDYRILLTGDNSEALLSETAMLSNKSEAHAHVWMEHQAPFCRSYQLFKNVLNDFSRSSFEGKIMVRQAAQKTEAFQLNNDLILSDHAHADSKPNLEIFADDVKASHGATVGQLDSEQLFYLKTRGFSDAQAKNLLIYGFCEEVIEKIPLRSLRHEISSRARQYLTKNAI